MGRVAFAPVLLLTLAACAPHSAPSAATPVADPPGTVKEVASAGALTDTATGDTYVKLDDTHSARLAVTGPVKLQADFRLAFAAEPPAGAVLVVHADDTTVQAYKIPSKTGSGTWKEGGRASLSTGFFIEVPEGRQQWEFRLRGASGIAGAIRVVASDKARAPLASTAPVLTYKPPAVAAISPIPSATAVPTASASPSVTPVPAVAALPSPAPAAPSNRSSSLAIEAGLVGYVRWSARRFDPVAPGIAVTALHSTPVEGLSAGASVGWRHHTGGRTFDEYGGRVLAPYVADIDAVPIEGVARYAMLVGPTRAFAQSGAGLEYARSSYTRADMLPARIRENDWAPTFSTAAGAEMPLAGGQLGARVGVRFARHAFAAHDFELLHGVEAVAGWQRSF